MPKTVRVRIAVAVDETGNWNACGASDIHPKDAAAFSSDPGHLSENSVVHWVWADLPVPEEIEVAGEVEGHDAQGHG